LSAIRRVLYLAAHGGFAGRAVPLGGGAAVSNLLIDEWRRGAPFAVTLITPAILGAAAPSAEEIVSFDERCYARFCRAFRDRSTDEVLRHDPRETAVLANDISEGPDFERLARAGYRMVSLWHVDVIAYIAAIYLRGRLSPGTLARAWNAARRIGLARLSPAIPRLIFEQQRECLRYASQVVVPSRGMRQVILESYAAARAELVAVVPWGLPPAAGTGGAVDLRSEFGVPADAPVLLCLSRISPEKGQDLLLEALIEWERSNEAVPSGLHLFICGLPAFMQGERYSLRVRRLAERLLKVKVVFPGYVNGERKQAMFRMADLYVFPSRHESYGLTLLEALGAGLPAVCLDHFGAREVMRPEFGAIVRARTDEEARLGLRREIARLLANGALRKRMGDDAAAYARSRPFADSAARIAELLTG
jgi:glycosyltransferase involved in cell wall biosynthesis